MINSKKAIATVMAASFFSANVYASDLSGWAETEYELASGAGLLSYNITQNSFSDNITRVEFCELAMNLFRQISDKEVYTPEEKIFVDCDSDAAAQAYALGIVSGKSETEFDPDGYITREEMAKLIINTLKAAEVNIVTLRSEATELVGAFDDGDMISPWAYSEVATALKYSVMSGVTENNLSPKDGAAREQAVAMVSRTYTQFAPDKSIYAIPELLSISSGCEVNFNTETELVPIEGAKKYMLIIKNSEGKTIDTFSSTTPKIKTLTDKLDENMRYTLFAGVEYKNGVQVFSLPTDVVYKRETKVITEIKTDAKTLNAKELRVFPAGHYFETEEEAAENMENITVDVWSIDTNGEKYATKKTLTVNRYLADDVKAVFKKIFDDPARFPIKSVGGYCWRETALGGVSQHSYGTCIDINPEENYYCYSESGEAITGTGWYPYENTYSITPDGAVVAAFAEYGWIWGGSWDGKVKDYMHFTYLGK